MLPQKLYTDDIVNNINTFQLAAFDLKAESAKNKYSEQTPISAAVAVRSSFI